LAVEVRMEDPDDLLAYPRKTFEVQAATEKMSADREKVRLRKIVRKYEGDWPSRLQGIAVGKAGSSVTAVELNAAIGLESKAAGVLTSEPRPVTETPNSAPETAVAAPQRSLPFMLLFAFLGGLILNIMPCVLPVIALKVLGFVNQSKESPALVRKHGMVYGLGVLVSFLVLAVIVIAVQHAGRAASWGMQFQNPQFLVVMTVLVTLVTLNLFGVFEVTLSGRAI